MVPAPPCRAGSGQVQGRHLGLVLWAELTLEVWHAGTAARGPENHLKFQCALELDSKESVRKRTTGRKVIWKDTEHAAKVSPLF